MKPHAASAPTDLATEVQLLSSAVEADRAGFFASSTVPFVIVRDGRFLDVNDAFAAVLGYATGELLGSSVYEHLHPDDHQATRDVAAELPAVGSGQGWTNRYRTREGGWRALRWVTWFDAGAQVYCGVAHDVSREETEVDRLSRLAYDDQLTGLANRTRLLESLERAIGGPGSLGVLFLDVDGFKAVNDGHGHAAGDALLRELGERLRGAVRRTDVLARLGGDEFVVVLPGLPDDLDEVRAGVRAAAGQLLAALDDGFTVAAGAVALGGSVGAAAWPWSGATAEELLAAADAAMYEAKRSADRDCRLHPSIA